MTISVLGINLTWPPTKVPSPNSTYEILSRWGIRLAELTILYAAFRYADAHAHQPLLALMASLIMIGLFLHAVQPTADVFFKVLPLVKGTGLEAILLLGLYGATIAAGLWLTTSMNSAVTALVQPDVPCPRNPTAAQSPTS